MEFNAINARIASTAVNVQLRFVEALLVMEDVAQIVPLCALETLLRGTKLNGL